MNKKMSDLEGAMATLQEVLDKTRIAYERCRLSSPFDSEYEAGYMHALDEVYRVMAFSKNKVGA